MIDESIPLDNPRIKVRKSNTTRQYCIACDGHIATKEDGVVISKEIVSISNHPTGNPKTIAFTKNFHIHVKCIDLFCEQLRYTAYPHDNERIIAWEPLDD
jgi:hypothetical protein